MVAWFIYLFYNQNLSKMKKELTTYQMCINALKLSLTDPKEIEIRNWFLNELQKNKKWVNNFDSTIFREPLLNLIESNQPYDQNKVAFLEKYNLMP